jgi:arylsulfatase A-like enzyme
VRSQTGLTRSAQAQQPASGRSVGGRPNILVIFGDDIGQSNIIAYTFGLMGYHTPNIDRIAREGIMFPITAPSRAAPRGARALLPGKPPCTRDFPRSGFPVPRSGSRLGIAEALKPLGYATGQFGKNRLGDRNEFLPTVHGFDEFFGNLYHLNAEEDPEDPDFPKTRRFAHGSARAGYSVVPLRISMIRPSTRGLAASASRRSRIPDR